MVVEGVVKGARSAPAAVRFAHYWSAKPTKGRLFNTHQNIHGGA